MNKACSSWYSMCRSRMPTTVASPNRCSQRITTRRRPSVKTTYSQSRMQVDSCMMRTSKAFWMTIKSNLTHMIPFRKLQACTWKSSFKKWKIHCSLPYQRRPRRRSYRTTFQFRTSIKRMMTAITRWKTGRCWPKSRTSRQLRRHT